MQKRIILATRIINLITGLAAIIINIIQTISPFNGRELADLSDKENKLIPYSTAFSIWGLIYIFKLIFLIYQLLPSTYNLNYINNGITPWFCLLALLNITWILTQAYFVDELKIVQLMVIYLMFIVLLIMYSSTFYYSKKYIKNSIKEVLVNYWCGRVWLPIYFSWITGAICVDSFSIFAKLKTTTYIASTITLVLLALIALLLLFINYDVAFGLTLIWTTSWIIVNHRNKEGAFPLWIASIVIISMITLACAVALVFNVKYLKDLKNRKQALSFNNDVITSKV